MTSKAAACRAMYAQGMETREIAKVVFSTDTPTQANLAYVRVAGRQRPEGATLNAANIKWRKSKYGTLEGYHKASNARSKPRRDAYYRDRYRDDPEYRAAKNEYNRNYYHQKRLEQVNESA